MINTEVLKVILVYCILGQGVYLGLRVWRSFQVSWRCLSLAQLVMRTMYIFCTSNSKLYLYLCYTSALGVAALCMGIGSQGQYDPFDRDPLLFQYIPALYWGLLRALDELASFLCLSIRDVHGCVMGLCLSLWDNMLGVLHLYDRKHLKYHSRH